MRKPADAGEELAAREVGQFDPRPLGAGKKLLPIFRESVVGIAVKPPLSGLG
jgi:hypothetical protein